MDKNTVRAEVDAFRKRTATDRNVEDCFPAWYLAHQYGLSDTQSLMQTSDPAIEGKAKGYDFGLDGFHLDLSEEKKPKLVLIQAKFSEAPHFVSSGFRELEKSLPKVADALERMGSDATFENKILINLRRLVAQVDEQTSKELNLEFVVIHLCDQDEMIIGANCRTSREDLRESLRDTFLDRNCMIREVGPRQMSRDEPVKPINDWSSLTLSALPLTVTMNERVVTMYSGIGHLAELVELYNQRRDDLFSKNVRYFLKSKRNVEKGPSSKIKETLKQICIKSQDRTVEPEIFALYHNGITIFARAVDTNQDGLITRIREPYILNGCQTVKTGYYFRHDVRLKNRIDNERWERIKIPLRIIVTRDDELIRQITVSNNRQNQISPAALRANDLIQIELADRFKESHIFYQRQEGAFDELTESNAIILENDYPKTNGRYVNIEDLARSLSAIAEEFDLAKSPSHIFEYDAAYNRCFSTKRLESITSLTFLQNLHDIIPLILKKNLDLQQKWNESPKATSLTYYTMCLFVRYLAKEGKQEFVQEFGGALWGKQNAFRNGVVSLLSNHKSHIKGALQDKFLSLDDRKPESLKGAFQRAETTLGLKDNIDVFKAFGTLDRTSD